MDRAFGNKSSGAGSSPGWSKKNFVFRGAWGFMDQVHLSWDGVIDLSISDIMDLSNASVWIRNGLCTIQKYKNCPHRISTIQSEKWKIRQVPRILEKKWFIGRLWFIWTRKLSNPIVDAFFCFASPICTIQDHYFAMYLQKMHLKKSSKQWI